MNNPLWPARAFNTLEMVSVCIKKYIIIIIMFDHSIILCCFLLLMIKPDGTGWNVRTRWALQNAPDAQKKERPGDAPIRRQHGPLLMEL